LFNPWDTPHEVVNVGPTLGVVGLFLDQSNIQECLTHTEKIIAKMEVAVEMKRRENQREEEKARCDPDESEDSESTKSSEDDGGDKNPYAALLSLDQLEMRLQRRRAIHEALDEIVFPDIEDDADFVNDEIRQRIARRNDDIDYLLAQMSMSEEEKERSGTENRKELTSMVGLFTLHDSLKHDETTRVKL